MSRSDQVRVLSPSSFCHRACEVLKAFKLCLYSQFHSQSSTVKDSFPHTPCVTIYTGPLHAAQWPIYNISSRPQSGKPHIDWSLSCGWDQNKPTGSFLSRLWLQSEYIEISGLLNQELNRTFHPRFDRRLQCEIRTTFKKINKINPDKHLSKHKMKSTRTETMIWSQSLFWLYSW